MESELWIRGVNETTVVQIIPQIIRSNCGDLRIKSSHYWINFEIMTFYSNYEIRINFNSNQLYSWNDNNLAPIYVLVQIRSKCKFELTVFELTVPDWQRFPTGKRKIFVILYHPVSTRHPLPIGVICIVFLATTLVAKREMV